MTKLYCLVENNAVTQGPVQLPTSFGNMTGFDHVTDPTVYGWLPYSDSGQPSFDGATQTLVRSFTINSEAKTVTQTYSVQPLPLAQVQANQDWMIKQSYQAKLKNFANTAIAKGDTKSAVQYLLKTQRTFP